MSAEIPRGNYTAHSFPPEDLSGLNETRTFKFDLAEGDDGIGGLIVVLNKIGRDLPTHHITSFDYERKGVLFLVTVTVAVEREQAA